MDKALTLDGQSFIFLAGMFIGMTLLIRFAMSVNKLPNSEFEEKISEKELWQASLAISGAMSVPVLLFMVLGYFFPGTGTPIEPYDVGQFMTW